jgi:hypothetical protein
MMQRMMDIKKVPIWCIAGVYDKNLFLTRSLEAHQIHQI